MKLHDFIYKLLFLVSIFLSMIQSLAKPKAIPNDLERLPNKLFSTRCSLSEITETTTFTNYIATIEVTEYETEGCPRCCNFYTRRLNCRKVRGDGGGGDDDNASEKLNKLGEDVEPISESEYLKLPLCGEGEVEYTILPTTTPTNSSSSESVSTETTPVETSPAETTPVVSSPVESSPTKCKKPQPNYPKHTFVDTDGKEVEEDLDFLFDFEDLIEDECEESGVLDSEELKVRKKLKLEEKLKPRCKPKASVESLNSVRQQPLPGINFCAGLKDELELSIFDVNDDTFVPTTKSDLCIVKPKGSYAESVQQKTDQISALVEPNLGLNYCRKSKAAFKLSISESNLKQIQDGKKRLCISKYNGSKDVQGISEAELVENYDLVTGRKFCLEEPTTTTSSESPSEPSGGSTSNEKTSVETELKESTQAKSTPVESTLSKCSKPQPNYPKHTFVDSDGKEVEEDLDFLFEFEDLVEDECDERGVLDDEELRVRKKQKVEEKLKPKCKAKPSTEILNSVSQHPLPGINFCTGSKDELELSIFDVNDDSFLPTAKGDLCIVKPKGSYAESVQLNTDQISALVEPNLGLNYCRKSKAAFKLSISEGNLKQAQDGKKTLCIAKYNGSKDVQGMSDSELMEKYDSVTGRKFCLETPTTTPSSEAESKSSSEERKPVDTESKESTPVKKTPVETTSVESTPSKCSKPQPKYPKHTFVDSDGKEVEEDLDFLFEFEDLVEDECDESGVLDDEELRVRKKHKVEEKLKPKCKPAPVANDQSGSLQPLPEITYCTGEADEVVFKIFDINDDTFVPTKVEDLCIVKPKSTASQSNLDGSTDPTVDPILNLRYCRKSKPAFKLEVATESLFRFKDLTFTKCILKYNDIKKAKQLTQDQLVDKYDPVTGREYCVKLPSTTITPTNPVESCVSRPEEGLSDGVEVGEKLVYPAKLLASERSYLDPLTKLKYCRGLKDEVGVKVYGEGAGAKYFESKDLCVQRAFEDEEERSKDGSGIIDRLTGLPLCLGNPGEVKVVIKGRYVEEGGEEKQCLIKLRPEEDNNLVEMKSGKKYCPYIPKETIKADIKTSDKNESTLDNKTTVSNTSEPNETETSKESIESENKSEAQPTEKPKTKSEEVPSEPAGEKSTDKETANPATKSDDVPEIKPTDKTSPKSDDIPTEPASEKSMEKEPVNNSSKSNDVPTEKTSERQNTKSDEVVSKPTNEKPTDKKPTDSSAKSEYSIEVKPTDKPNTKSEEVVSEPTNEKSTEKNPVKGSSESEYEPTENSSAKSDEVVREPTNENTTDKKITKEATKSKNEYEAKPTENTSTNSTSTATKCSKPPSKYPKHTFTNSQGKEVEEDLDFLFEFEDLVEDECDDSGVMDAEELRVRKKQKLDEKLKPKCKPVPLKSLDGEREDEVVQPLPGIDYCTKVQDEVELNIFDVNDDSFIPTSRDDLCIVKPKVSPYTESEEQMNELLNPLVEPSLGLNYCRKSKVAFKLTITDTNLKQAKDGKKTLCIPKYNNLKDVEGVSKADLMENYDPVTGRKFCSKSPTTTSTTQDDSCIPRPKEGLTSGVEVDGKMMYPAKLLSSEKSFVDPLTNLSYCKGSKNEVGIKVYGKGVDPKYAESQDLCVERVFEEGQQDQSKDGFDIIDSLTGIPLCLGNDEEVKVVIKGIYIKEGSTKKQCLVKLRPEEDTNLVETKSGKVYCPYVPKEIKETEAKTSDMIGSTSDKKTADSNKPESSENESVKENTVSENKSEAQPTDKPNTKSDGVTSEPAIEKSTKNKYSDPATKSDGVPEFKPTNKTNPKFDDVASEKPTEKESSDPATKSNGVPEFKPTDKTNSKSDDVTSAPASEKPTEKDPVKDTKKFNNVPTEKPTDMQNTKSDEVLKGSTYKKPNEKALDIENTESKNLPDVKPTDDVKTKSDDVASEKSKEKEPTSPASKTDDVPEAKPTDKATSKFDEVASGSANENPTDKKPTKEATKSKNEYEAKPTENTSTNSTSTATKCSKPPSKYPKHTFTDSQGNEVEEDLDFLFEFEDLIDDECDDSGVMDAEELRVRKKQKLDEKLKPKCKPVPLKPIDGESEDEVVQPLPGMAYCTKVQDEVELNIFDVNDDSFIPTSRNDLCIVKPKVSPYTESVQQMNELLDPLVEPSLGLSYCRKSKVAFKLTVTETNLKQAKDGKKALCIPKYNNLKDVEGLSETDLVKKYDPVTGRKFCPKAPTTTSTTQDDSCMPRPKEGLTGGVEVDGKMMYPAKLLSSEKSFVDPLTNLSYCKGSKNEVGIKVYGKGVDPKYAESQELCAERVFEEGQQDQSKDGFDIIDSLTGIPLCLGNDEEVKVVIKGMYVKEGSNKKQCLVKLRPEEDTNLVETKSGKVYCPYVPKDIKNTDTSTSDKDESKSDNKTTDSIKSELTKNETLGTVKKSDEVVNLKPTDQPTPKADKIVSDPTNEKPTEKEIGKDSTKSNDEPSEPASQKSTDKNPDNPAAKPNDVTTGKPSPKSDKAASYSTNDEPTKKEMVKDNTKSKVGPSEPVSKKATDKEPVNPATKFDDEVNVKPTDKPNPKTGKVTSDPTNEKPTEKETVKDNTKSKYEPSEPASKKDTDKEPVYPATKSDDEVNVKPTDKPNPKTGKVTSDPTNEKPTEKEMVKDNTKSKVEASEAASEKPTDKESVNPATKSDYEVSVKPTEKPNPKTDKLNSDPTNEKPTEKEMGKDNTKSKYEPSEPASKKYTDKEPVYTATKSDDEVNVKPTDKPNPKTGKVTSDPTNEKPTEKEMVKDNTKSKVEASEAASEKPTDKESVNPATKSDYEVSVKPTEKPNPKTDKLNSDPTNEKPTEKEMGKDNTKSKYEPSEPVSKKDTDKEPVYPATKSDDEVNVKPTDKSSPKSDKDVGNPTSEKPTGKESLNEVTNSKNEPIEPVSEKPAEKETVNPIKKSNDEDNIKPTNKPNPKSDIVSDPTNEMPAENESGKFNTKSKDEPSQKSTGNESIKSNFKSVDVPSETATENPTKKDQVDPNTKSDGKVGEQGNGKPTDKKSVNEATKSKDVPSEKITYKPSDKEPTKPNTKSNDTVDKIKTRPTESELTEPKEIVLTDPAKTKSSDLKNGVKVKPSVEDNEIPPTKSANSNQTKPVDQNDSKSQDTLKETSKLSPTSNLSKELATIDSAVKSVEENKSEKPTSTKSAASYPTSEPEDDDDFNWDEYLGSETENVANGNAVNFAFLPGNEFFDNPQSFADPEPAQPTTNPKLNPVPASKKDAVVESKSDPAPSNKKDAASENKLDSTSKPPSKPELESKESPKASKYNLDPTPSPDPQQATKKSLATTPASPKPTKKLTTNKSPSYKPSPKSSASKTKSSSTPSPTKSKSKSKSSSKTTSKAKASSKSKPTFKRYDEDSDRYDGYDEDSYDRYDRHTQVDRGYGY